MAIIMLKEIIVHGCYHGACGWVAPAPMAVLFQTYSSLKPKADVIQFNPLRKIRNLFLNQPQEITRKAA
jgi:hypothetical protein